MIETKRTEPGAVKSALLKWLGVPIGLVNGEFWSMVAGGESSAGKSVTVDSAMRLSAVWSCVRLLSETVATLPVGFYQRTETGRIEARDHPLYDLLHYQPNADITAVEFWESVMASMLLWGNAYVEIVRVGKRIVAMEFLLPARIKLKRLGDGSIEYAYRDEVGTSSRIIPEADMMHIRAFGIGGMVGLSPVSYARESLGSAMAAEESSAAIHANGMRPQGVYEFDRMLTGKEREDFRASLANITGSINAGKAPLLEGGIKYKQITLNPDDVQMLETRAFNIEEVCRWFRVDPVLIGHKGEGQTMWGSGVESLLIAFMTFSMRPWLTRIEQSIRRCLLAPGEKNAYFAEFSIEGLLRADSAARSAFYSTMAQNGVMTRNEIRAKENLPPDPDGDVLTVQSNLLPIGKLGSVTSSETAKSALQAWLGGEKEASNDTA